MSNGTSSTAEEWRAIPDFEGFYSASNFGRIRSETRWKRPCEPKVLKPHENAAGYFRVSMWKRGKVAYRLVHRMVLLAFIGSNPEKPQCNHMDRNTKNNRLENLEWCTAKENGEHAARTVLYGRLPKPRRFKWKPPVGYVFKRGEKHYAHKLTENDVKEIRSTYASGACSQQALANRFGIAQTGISAIVLRKKWKHVS